MGMRPQKNINYLDIIEHYNLNAIHKYEVFNMDPLRETVMITWNPSNRFWRDQSNHEGKWKEMIGRGLCKLNRCCTSFQLVAEVSTMGRLHCHGWIQISDIIKWHKSVLPFFNRTAPHGFKMKVMTNIKQLWYYVKDVDITSHLIEKLPIYINSENIGDMTREIMRRRILNMTKNELPLSKKNVMDMLGLEEPFDDDL